MKSIRRLNTFLAIVAVLLLGVGSAMAIRYAVSNEQKSNPSPSSSSQQVQDEEQQQNVDTTDTTKQQLLFLIEEEKLAHDVYTAMYQKYGAKVFGNILRSESTHQNRVLTLLQARNIADPRSAEIGVFNNQDLQNFYNQLIEQGNKNEVEAYKVGVAIEERDIADISKQLATSSDADVITTLEDLRRGSENHLRAFNRQL